MQWVPQRSCGGVPGKEHPRQPGKVWVSHTHLLLVTMTNKEAPHRACGAPSTKTLERLRDEPLQKERHTEQWTARTRWGVASRMSQRHLPTNAGHGRPAEHQRCCGRKPRHCLRCVRSHPTDGAPRLGSRRVRRLPAPVHRLLLLLLRQSGLNSLSLLFCFGSFRQRVIG